ncbi:BlaI/MecI/CopY family transcriptional regulator [Flammeovirgaceae bacterium SG7u.111]|nr:BlaI/MecI/CopY family transcriptional regulator [Flammeovirgaceae bacterium SG7u.132]WPO34119.1 BlaI/MecI/CopY family transcriptional regulator [Flammeovirgaceae bacterium SG7u.111]
MRELTQAEEKVMQILWELKEAFVRDILEKFEGDKKPSYTTVSTVIRVLEGKGFVDHKVFGNTHLYFPKVSKEEYSEFAAFSMLEKYFSGSVGKLVSFFAKKEKVDIQDLDEVIKLINEKKSEE